METIRDFPTEQLTSVLENLVHQLRRATASGGLSSTASSTLHRLAASGPQRVTDLARQERVSQPAMTQLVGRLVGEGLAVRRASEDDGRVSLVEATDAAVATLDERHRARVARVDTMLDVLTEREQELLAAALPALQKLVDAPIDSAG